MYTVGIKEFPILEFDEDKDAFIRPTKIITALDNISEVCVLCFFSDAIEKILKEFPYKTVSYLKSEGITCPVYELNYKGTNIGLIQACVGAPMAAGQIEELTALGYNKFIACGCCGVLQKEIAVGHLIIPTSAVRDEGTSYHYIKPSREIIANADVVKIIEEVLTEKQLPYIKAKTWTTDAMYRETVSKINLRRKEGCVTVEMEASAYMAVAEYNKVAFGQLLYSGDTLAGTEWDSRDYAKRNDIREYVLRITLDIGLRMKQCAASGGHP
jgi:uridine phosphorylase